MSAYVALAGRYDALTRDVDYAAFADYYQSVFSERGGEYRLLLDLGCGTGTLTCLLASRGFDMIGADASPEMLMQAREKAVGLGRATPLLICQSAAELDLFGTVDAAVSSLDAVSYMKPSELPEVFRRLHLFIRPGGLLIFDVRTPEFLQGMDGSVSVDETEDTLCLWRGSFDAERGELCYGLDLFERQGGLWRRSGEEHIEYAHRPEELGCLLESAGFGNVQLRSDGPQGGDGRLFVIAERI